MGMMTEYYHYIFTTLVSREQSTEEQSLCQNSILLWRFVPCPKYKMMLFNLHFLIFILPWITSPCLQKKIIAQYSFFCLIFWFLHISFCSSSLYHCCLDFPLSLIVVPVLFLMFLLLHSSVSSTSCADPCTFPSQHFFKQNISKYNKLVLLSLS